MLKVAHRIKELRIQQGLSQDELALKMGYRTRSSINKIEKGLNAVPLKKLEKLAKILGTTTDYLINGNQSNNLLDHFNAVSDYIDQYPYHLLYFSKEYKQELYNKLKQLDTENYLSKDFSIYSTAEEFWKVINYFDLDVDDSRLIQIKPEDKEYYIDYTIYSDKQLLELDTITKMVVSLFERQDNFTEKNKKILKKFISDFYKKTM
ncbi:helix-turn-helix transcriptional regulator [Sneathia sanguinegens]|uniref:helix-turn-helix domain-containing protein n=1 Tax=Sneathia sanguinegens TaxID=40543 RepID=UPI002590F900|nr:helix-turn-helix transcriptional regulator [Sneathia sanguinegens]MDU4653087.1 helix-turn-helix transcriptional regulator [Sneathia sanguinegens]